MLSLEPRTDYALPHQGRVDNNGCGLVLVYKTRLIPTTSQRPNTPTASCLCSRPYAVPYFDDIFTNFSKRTSQSLSSHFFVLASSLLLKWPHTFATSLAVRRPLLPRTERPSHVDGRSPFRPQHLSTSTQPLKGTYPRLTQGHH